MPAGRKRIVLGSVTRVTAGSLGAKVPEGLPSVLRDLQKHRALFPNSVHHHKLNVMT